MISGMGKLFYIAVNSGKACGPQLQRGAAAEPLPHRLLCVLHRTQFLPRETRDLPGPGTPAEAVIAPPSCTGGVCPPIR